MWGQQRRMVLSLKKCSSLKVSNVGCSGALTPRFTLGHGRGRFCAAVFGGTQERGPFAIPGASVGSREPKESVGKALEA